MTLARDVRWAPRVGEQATGHVRLREAVAAELIPLRRRVLREGRELPPASVPEDDDPASVHLAAIAAGGEAGGTVVGALTLTAQPFPDEPGADAVRLSLMAVDPDHQRHGIGGDLVALAQQLATGRVELIWATARDSVLGFYERRGFLVTGPGFAGAMNLPHHLVVWRAHAHPAG